MTPASTLSSDRLELSPPVWPDFVFFWRLLGDRDVRRYLGGPVSASNRWRQFRLYRRGHPNIGIWMVRMTQQNARAGLLVLGHHHDTGHAEISFQFATQSQRRGYAREAVGRVLRHAFDDLGLETVVAETQSANSRSCKMLEQLGFEAVDHLERYGARQTVYAASAPRFQRE